jgi:hypothetical protein
MIKYSLLFIGLLSILSAPISSMEVYDGDLSLLPEETIQPSIAGIEFYSEPHHVTKLLASYGLVLLSQEKQDDEGFSMLLRFRGIPKGYGIQDGETTMLFFKKQLVRIDYHFDASYSNFLLVREVLKRGIDNRYTLKKNHEIIDRHLRSYLSSLKPNEYNKHSEMMIRKSMNQRKTYFFYQLKDQRNQVDSTYSFTAETSSNDEKEARLVLHFSLKEGMQKLRAHSEKVKQTPRKRSFQR